MSTPVSDEALRSSLSSIITGTEDPQASSSGSGSGSGSTATIDDDLTPFPSPVLSATSLAGLSRQSAANLIRRECVLTLLVSSDGELEQEVDEDRIVTDQDREQAAELKAQANKAFAGE